MDYEAFHDESQASGYWHGILLVPMLSKARVCELLTKARATTRYQAPLSMKRVSKPNRVFDCAKAWLTIGLAAMSSKWGADPIPIFLGQAKPGIWEYTLLREQLGLKFILFRERDNLSAMNLHTDYGSKVETTFRMALKGGLHFMGDEDHPIAIQRLHFDGHRHYHRHIDAARIVGRISGLRGYCHIANRPDLVDDASSDHTRGDAQGYDDCQLLQLSDLLIGSFRAALLGPESELRARLSYSAASLLLRFAQGPARMANSRWRKSFWLSQCYIEDGTWRFQPLEAEAPDYGTQLTFLQ